MRGCIHWHDSGACIVCNPFQFDSLCEVHGEAYPRNGAEYDDYIEWQRSLNEQPIWSLM